MENINFTATPQNAIEYQKKTIMLDHLHSKWFVENQSLQRFWVEKGMPQSPELY